MLPRIALGLIVVVGAACSEQPTVSIGSLSELSVEALRERSYNATIKREGLFKEHCGATTPSDGGSSYTSHQVSYDSDGLRVYARIDIPDVAAPVEGFPTLIIAHGWVGIEGAATYSFACDSSSHSAYIDAFAHSGYVVVTPGFRGHGTFAGRQADGIEYIAAWDNGSYLSPIFYALDILNLAAGLKTTNVAPINSNRMYLSGHSQGGDVALTVLAASGEGGDVRFAGASIFSGNIPDRFTQLQTFAAMQSSPQAFLAGDGTWNGTSTGKNGQRNEAFVFGYPPPWIGTPSPTEWDWQNETYSTETVMDAVVGKLAQMYSTINLQVADVDSASYSIAEGDAEIFAVLHDPKVEAAMGLIGGYGEAQWPYLTEPLNLHFSDRDFYSFPAWNRQVCDEMTARDNRCAAFEYPGNTHGLQLSDKPWFSAAHHTAGYETMIERDKRLFAAD